MPRIMKASTIIALDPGSEKTAWLIYDGEPSDWGYELNADVREHLGQLALRFFPKTPVLAVEYMRPRGMPTSKEEMDTMFELGRMVEAWGGKWKPIGRHEVKMHVCRSAKATDANIRAALIDHFGGRAAIAPAGKCEKCKGRGKTGLGRLRGDCIWCKGSGRGKDAGILHGISGDVWQALGVAVTAAAQLGHTRYENGHTPPSDYYGL